MLLLQLKVAQTQFFPNKGKENKSHLWKQYKSAYFVYWPMIFCTRMQAQKAITENKTILVCLVAKETARIARTCQPIK